MTTKFTLTALAALMSCATMAQAPAFPGAEGHGRYVTGGRGGTIVHVTNLNDSGAGSFREAVSKSNRIVVFDVGGVIALKSGLSIKGNITIEGQTAPAPGITLRYYTVQPNGNNIIIRFIRFRRGEERDTNDGADAIWGRKRTGLILDHCSMSWSTDELSSFYDNNNFTMQWCMLGEGLNFGHSKGEHSYGGIWGGKLASFHHNYLGFVQNRVPRFNGARYNWTGYTSNKNYSQYQWKNAVQAENVDFRNCVMYNWGSGGCYGGPGGGYINIVNNYYKAGPGTKTRTRITQVSTANSTTSSTNNTYIDMTSRYYISGNYMSAAGASARNYDWKGVVYDSGIPTIGGERYSYDVNHYYATGNDTITYLQSDGKDCVKIKLDQPGAPTGEITTQDAETAYEKVLTYAGASLWRDVIDAEYVEETKTGTAYYIGSQRTDDPKGIIDLATDNKNCYSETSAGWGLTKSTLKDSDNDGMPDDFEIANGLNPHDAKDANAYTIDSKVNGGRGWYTNIEVYCNWLVENIMKAENEGAVSSVDEYYPVVKTTATGIAQAVTDNTPVASKYYALDGSEIKDLNSFQGILFRIDTLRDGNRVAQKMIR